VPIYVNSIAGTLRRMLESLGLAYDAADFDTTAWAFAEADLPGIVAFHQCAIATTTLSAAEDILAGSGAILAAGRGGKLRLADPLATDAPQFDLPAACVLSCEPLPLPASLRPLPRAIAVRWRRNHAPLSNMAGSVAAADRQRLSQEGSFARAESSLITSRVAQQREISFPAAYWTEAEALARAEKWRALLEAGPRMVLAANYVAEDGGEAIYRSMEFPLTTSVATVQRIMKAELERNRRQREVAFPANLSALRLRPWDSVTLALDRLGPFPARVTGWRLAPDGGVDLTLAEEDPAIWDWDPAVDERATGDSPSVVLPNPGVIAAPATISVETPSGIAFTALSLSWAAVGSAYLSGYELEFRPASVAAWQGYGGALSATAASIATSEPTAFRLRAVARSGAVSGWQEAAIPGGVTALAALGIAGGVRLSGILPPEVVRLQVFEASSADLSQAVKLASEPTALPWCPASAPMGPNWRFE